MMAVLMMTVTVLNSLETITITKLSYLKLLIIHSIHVAEDIGSATGVCV